MANLGPLSRMLAEAIRRCRDADSLVPVLDDLLVLTQSVLEHWRRNKLSTMEISREEDFLTVHTRNDTWPALWGFFQRLLYSTIVRSCNKLSHDALFTLNSGRINSGVL